VFAVKILEVDDLHLAKILILLHLTAVAAAVPSFGYLVPSLEAIGAEPRSLKSSLDGIPNLSLFLGEGRHFGGVFLDLI